MKASVERPKHQTKNKKVSGWSNSQYCIYIYMYALIHPTQESTWKYMYNYICRDALNLGVKIYTYKLVTQTCPMLRCLLLEQFHCIHKIHHSSIQGSYSVFSYKSTLVHPLFCKFLHFPFTFKVALQRKPEIAYLCNN